MRVTRLKPWPIVAGVLIDTVGSAVLGVLFVAGVLAVAIARNSLASDGIISASNVVVLEIVGLLPCVAGGFAAARMAGKAPVQHAVAVGMTVCLVWLVIELGLPGEPPRAARPNSSLVGWVSFLGVIPASVLGGYIAAKRRRYASRTTARS